MKLKKIITRISTIGTIVVACTTHSPKNNLKTATQYFENDKQLTELLTDTFGHKYSDLEKIIEFNKLLKKYNKPVDNYVVINKKNCTSVVYSPSGDTLYINEVALGKEIGDKRCGGYLIKNAPLKAYTTPGEFVISHEGSRKESKNNRLYGQKILTLKGDHTLKAYQKTQTLALHQVPNTPMGELRIQKLQNNSIEDNRMSFGCVNYLPQDYDSMRTFINGKNTKVYVLPEEQNNTLHLEQQADSTYKFYQTKYRHEEQE